MNFMSNLVTFTSFKQILYKYNKRLAIIMKSKTQVKSNKVHVNFNTFS